MQYISHMLLKMNSLTLLLVTVALVGSASAFPRVNQKAVVQNALKTMIQQAQEKAMLEHAYKQFADQQQAKEEEKETTNEMDAANIMTENRKMAVAIQMLLGKLDTTNEMADLQAAQWWCVWIPQPVRITLPACQ